MTCSTESIDLNPGMQILLILWLHVMYHQEVTKEGQSRRVVPTYGMNDTSSKHALIVYSQDVYQLKKESK